MDPGSGRQVFIDHSTQATTWLDPRPPPFLSDASSGASSPPAYSTDGNSQPPARYGPAYAAAPAPTAPTAPVYAQPAFAQAPVAYGGVQSSSANTGAPGSYATPAFATAPGYAQPQYATPQYATPQYVTNGAVVVVPAKMAQPVVYVPVPAGSPLLAAGVLVWTHIYLFITFVSESYSFICCCICAC
jgi:hypothetical protein